MGRHIWGVCGWIEGLFECWGKGGWWSSHGGGFAAGTGFVCALFAAVLDRKAGEINGDGLDASWSDLEDSCSCSTRA